MSKITTSDAARARKTAQARTLAEADAKLADVRQRIGHLAVSIRCALNDIADLMQMGEGKTGPIDPDYPQKYPDWKEFLHDLTGWKFTLALADGQLGGDFIGEVDAALEEAGLLDKEDSLS